MLTLGLTAFAAGVGIVIGAATGEHRRERLESDLAYLRKVTARLRDQLEAQELEGSAWAREAHSALDAALRERDELRDQVEDLEERLAAAVEAKNQLLAELVGETDEREDPAPPHYHPRASPEPSTGFPRSRVDRPADRPMGS